MITYSVEGLVGSIKANYLPPARMAGESEDDHAERCKEDAHQHVLSHIARRLQIRISEIEFMD